MCYNFEFKKCGKGMRVCVCVCVCMSKPFFRTCAYCQRCLWCPVSDQRTSFSDLASSSAVAATFSGATKSYKKKSRKLTHDDS